MRWLALTHVGRFSTSAQIHSFHFSTPPNDPALFQNSLLSSWPQHTPSVDEIGDCCLMDLNRLVPKDKGCLNQQVRKNNPKPDHNL